MIQTPLQQHTEWCSIRLTNQAEHMDELICFSSRGVSCTPMVICQPHIITPKTHTLNTAHVPYLVLVLFTVIKFGVFIS